MKAVFSGLILYIVLFICVLSFGAWDLPKADAAFACQVTYGGGQTCQGQSLLNYSYPAPAMQPVATPTGQSLLGGASIPTTTHLPATGASEWGYLLITLAGVAGIIIHLFLQYKPLTISY